jgi:hypothetical protein
MYEQRTVAVYLSANSRANFDIATYDTERELLNLGFQIISLPKDWQEWRKSGSVTRERLNSDPALIIEIDQGSWRPEKSEDSEWSVGFRVYSPDGRLRTSQIVRHKYFEDVAAHLKNLVTCVDYELEALLSKPAAGKTKGDTCDYR